MEKALMKALLKWKKGIRLRVIETKKPVRIEQAFLFRLLRAFGTRND